MAIVHVANQIHQAILKRQTYAMFANDQAVMIGGGQVWFSKSDHEVLVTVVNQ